MTGNYYSQMGGHPPQTQLLTGRAVFTRSYAVIPKDVMQDIVASVLPYWDATRAWIIARPLSGFAESFAQYVMEVAPGGGSDKPEPDSDAECVLFFVSGGATVTISSQTYNVMTGGYVYIPSGTKWVLRNNNKIPAKFHWIRKSYEPVEGIAKPEAFVTSDTEVVPVAMPGTNGTWSTTRFADPTDIRHDMHVNIVTFQPGGTIPFAETHVMEHGLYVLEGKAVYRLNDDWVEVEAGDFLWLRAFCPQACYAGGPGPFRYLLYKDVNRHPKLKLFR